MPSRSGTPGWTELAASADADDQAAFELGQILSGERRESLVFEGTLTEPLSHEVQAEGLPIVAWQADEPETISHMHELYGLAGADVALTATTEATAPVLERLGMRVPIERIARLAARSARAGSPRFVMGEIGPCGVTEPSKARAAYAELAAALAPHVHGLMVSSCVSALDARAALDACRAAAPSLPVCVSLACDADATLSYGETLAETFSALASAGATAVGVDGLAADELVAIAPVVADAARRAHVRVVVRPSAGESAANGDGTRTWRLGAADAVRCLHTAWSCGITLLGTGDGFGYAATCAAADVAAGL